MLSDDQNLKKKNDKSNKKVNQNMQEKKCDLNLNFKRTTDIMKAQYNIKTQNKSTKKMLIMMSIFFFFEIK